MKLSTLCYIEKDNRYLMLHRVKKQNDVNHNKWIGVGGHFEQDESPEECVLREVYEETGLTLLSLRFRGVITFVTKGWETEYISLFTSDNFTGSIKECREGVLEWVNKDALTSLNLWEGDRIFLKLLKENAPFFSMKLHYCGDRLTEASLNNRKLELLELYGEDGNPTGIIRERNLIHEDGSLHATVHIWLIRQTVRGFDVLLQKRSAGKDAFPGYYDISSAGHLEIGESYIKAALREFNEELGIQADPSCLNFIGMYESFIHKTFYNRPFHNHEISAVYVYAGKVEDKDFKLQAEEVEAVLWMDYEECLNGIRKQTLKTCIAEDEFVQLKNHAIRILS